jgi:molybdenum cofactor cytidylyltransferase
MASPTEPFVSGLVLAAGGSRRLGEPKQLLPFGGTTLLDRVLDTARSSPFHQLIVALGGGAEEIRGGVDLSGTEVVVNDDYASGCSSSIAAGLGAVNERASVLVLMLGDQPGVTSHTVRSLLAGRGGDTRLAVCRYEDGPGHPLAFGRAMFGELERLHGDKAVWKLIDRLDGEVVEVPVPGRIPPDVDTREDYEAVLAAAGLRS